LYRSRTIFNIEYFLEHGMTPEEVADFEATLEVVELAPGTAFDMAPGYVHRVYATTDLEFIEVSTAHVDDVIRLQDDQGRSHGKIQSEHE
jgi:mannose-6-phosphate isomerase class I